MGSFFSKSVRFGAALGLTTAIFSGCAKSSGTNNSDQYPIAANIVGGTLSPDSFQKENGIVGIVIIKDEGAGICTGTLISRKIVLTAAHCLDNRTGEIKSVAVVFATDIRKALKEQVRQGTRAKSHENFAAASFAGAGSWDDIALIKLNDDAPVDFKTVTLPVSGFLNKLDASSKLVESGFGRTTASNNPTDNPPEADQSGTLRHVDGISILGLSADAKELLLKEDGKGSCKGDSGGPTFVKTGSGKLVQLGINSRGNNSNNCLDVGIYTSVEAHLAWIAQNAQDLMLNK